MNKVHEVVLFDDVSLYMAQWYVHIFWASHERAEENL